MRLLGFQYDFDDTLCFIGRKFKSRLDIVQRAVVRAQILGRHRAIIHPLHAQAVIGTLVFHAVSERKVYGDVFEYSFPGVHWIKVIP